ncbi:MAG: prolipoprotein diacylglyceryl transferase, partial [Exiguobacterium sp.]|nr:prolipoprotein diacylglyceryl transferase [Exiguobacterium sp.]
SIGRFYIEGLRTDSLMSGDLRAAQMVSIALILFGIVTMILRRKAKRYNDPSEKGLFD